MEKEQVKRTHFDALKSTLLDMASTAHMLAERLNKDEGTQLTDEEQLLIKVAKMRMVDNVVREMKMMYLSGYDEVVNGLDEIHKILVE